MFFGTISEHVASCGAPSGGLARPEGGYLPGAKVEIHLSHPSPHIPHFKSASNMEACFVKKRHGVSIVSPPGSQNDSKMEPKMEPGRQRPTLTKHAQALPDCISTPPWGPLFQHFFPRPQQYNKHMFKNTTIQTKCAKIIPKRSPFW